MKASPKFPRGRGLVFTYLIVVVLVIGSYLTLRAMPTKIQPQSLLHQATMPTEGLTCLKRLAWATSDESSQLLSLAALSKQDVWAVGTQKGTMAVAMHWDGTSWKSSSLPLQANSSALYAVAAAGPSDLWAAGRADTRPIVLHWDGNAWTAVTLPSDTAVSSQLVSLAVLSGHDIWATGNALATKQGTPYPIAMHWDGAAWHTSAVPLGLTSFSVSVNTSSSVWGLGVATDHTQKLFRWNGSRWLAGPALDTTAVGLDISAMAVGADGGLWVAGSYYAPSSGDTGGGWHTTVVEHYDGATWSIIPSAGMESRGDQASAIALAADGSAWIAGSLRDPNTRLSMAYVQHLGGSLAVLSLYPSHFDDPARSSSFAPTAFAVTPDGSVTWLAGSLGAPPDPARPPIDSNLPTAAGGFLLALC